MSIILAVLLILAGSTFCTTIFNKKIEETIILYIMMSIILVYFFGLIGHLNLGVYAFIILSIILFIAGAVIIIKSKNKKEILKNIFTPGLLIFIVLSIALLYFHRERLFSLWDEFTHWGSSIKSMFKINDFSTSPNSSLYFQSYPPAMTIFQYIFMFIKGEFVEYYAYYSYDLFCFSLFLPFLSKIKWKNVLKIFVYTLLVIIIPAFFYQYFYLSIYIDAVLGLTFGFIVALIIKQKENYGIYEIILLSLSLMILVMQKDTGMFLAAIAILMFAIDMLLFKDKIKLKKENMKELVKKIVIIMIPIICIIIVKTAWNHSIQINNALVKFSGKYDVKQIVNIFLGRDETYRTKVANGFIKACFTINIYKSIISLNTIQLGIIFSIIFIILSKICKFTKRENTYSIITIIGFFTYLFGLMITYMYKFSEKEAMTIASFDRYINIYLTSMIFIITLIFMNHEKNSNKVICMFALVILLFSPLDTIRQTHSSIEDSKAKREEYAFHAEKIKSVVSENDKIYFLDINNEDKGYTYWVIRYLLVPTKFNGNHELDIVDLEKFKETIFKDYDYVYINGFDEEFMNKYRFFFENLTDHSLYKVKEDKLIKIY